MNIIGHKTSVKQGKNKMVFSYYLSKYPYKLIWNLLKLMGKTEKVVFYCGNEIDIKIFEPIQKYLPSMPIVVKNKKIKKHLKTLGIESKCLPCFPEMVITCRQAAYRFPEEKILKFGFRHGPYHFKPFANITGYNMNTEFFMTSSQEVKEAIEAGITCATAVGYPKIDYAFDGTYDEKYLQILKDKIGISSQKKTVLFTATWDKSGVSGIAKWYDKLSEFTLQYNVLVTVHPSTSEHYIEKIKSTSNVYFIEDKNAVPYIMLSDVCIGDTSSILAECSALKKPIITFALPDGKRTVQKTMDIIKSISYRINNLDELNPAITYALTHPHQKDKQMDVANKIMFDELDGLAGKRAADIILNYLQTLDS